MKLSQAILPTVTATLLVIWLVIGLHNNAYNRLQAQKKADIQLVENLPKKALPYMQAQDIAIRLLGN